jgi:hypothetical protein
MAIGPGLVGFLFGVGFGGRKVLGNCKECGGKCDVDTMPWDLGTNFATGRSGGWWRQTCRERYAHWEQWRKTQDNSVSYRNEEERKWARDLWESDPGYLLEDVIWQGPERLGFPDQPLDTGNQRKE